MENDGAAHKRGEEWEGVVKAYVFSAEAPPDESRQKPIAEDVEQFGDAIVAPPYRPDYLCRLYERSHALRPPIDAYVVNIESFGFHLEPSIDMTSEKADERIAESIAMEKLYDDPTLTEIPEVSSAEVKERRRLIEKEMPLERLQVENFFRHAVAGMAWVELLARLRVDEEVTGNGYVEIVRDRGRELRELHHSQSLYTRLRKHEPAVEVSVPQKISAISYRYVPVRRRFRSFAQRVGPGAAVHFKELGDPRLRSSVTGIVYDKYKPNPQDDPELDEQARADAEDRNLRHMKKAEPEATAATEMMHSDIYAPGSIYGVPRWVGATLAVVGTRESEEVNAAYFHQKAVPPFAILVSGGALAKGARQQIEQYIQQHIVGKENFHNVLILEAESKGTTLAAQQNTGAPRVRIEIQPLQHFQQRDALFQNYDARNSEKVRNMFRIPKLLVGDAVDVNRATAQSALRQAEQQVFQPLRQKRDHMVNEILFPQMGIRYWRYVSNGPVSSDPPELADVLERVNSAMTPNEQREVIAGILNRELPMIEEAWATKPLPIYEAELKAGIDNVEGPEGPTVPEGANLVQALVGLRERLREAAAERFNAEDAATRQRMIDKSDDDEDDLPAEPVTVAVPAEVFDSWLAKDGDKE